MGPNDAEIPRVFSREVGSTIADFTFAYDSEIEIVVDAEAGPSVFGGGAQFDLRVIVRDLKNFELIPVKESDAVSGALGVDWTDQATQFVFTIPALGPTKEGAILEVIATLRIRVTRPDVSFARSPLFFIYRP